MEVRPLSRSTVLSDRKGAFVDLVTWAADPHEFESRAGLVFGDLGLFVVGIENLEPVADRKKKTELNADVEEMIERAESDLDAIIYGTFHTWRRDTA